ncbi:MAG: peptidoglycan-binding protein [Myxococcaceae bacterium]
MKVTSSGTVSSGASGNSVRDLQSQLKALGFNPGPIDGVFGPATKKAVIAFQKSRHLAADGIVGPKTRAALTTARKKPAPAKKPAATKGTSKSAAPKKAPKAYPTVKMGSRGSAVLALQKALKAKGFSPGALDGVFGPGTLGAVRRFQGSKKLATDGVVGPNTWKALGYRGTGSTAGSGSVGSVTPASGSLRQKILQMARSQLGTLEVGNNGGGARKYQSYFGRGQESWCADFVSWVVSHSGKKLNFAYCPYLESYMRNSGHWKGKSNPQPGDIVLFDWDQNGVADHVGIVESVNKNGSINTIEGNTTNPSTGREGVWRRTRYLSQVRGFANP